MTFLKSTSRGALLLLLSQVLGGSVLAQAAATAPAPPASALRQGGYFAAAPPAFQDFFARAAVADKIADPLQRCLAFPDMPGNQWSPGLAAAYCELTSGASVRLAEVDTLLKKGAHAELDALFRRDLERHFSAASFSEVIHRNFDAFNATDDAERISRLWLALAPGSPFALTARANHLASMGWKRRGHKAAGLTPGAAMAALESLTTEAVFLLNKAIGIEPRLIHAHVKLVDISRHGTYHEAGEVAFRQGQALDPGCHYLIVSRMMGLQPRWGGSHQAMAAYAIKLDALRAKRPLVKLSALMVAEDMAHVLNETERWSEAIGVGRTSTGKVPNVTAHYRLGTSLMGDEAAATANRWEALAAGLTAYRFDAVDPEHLDSLGRKLYNIGDNAWARKVLAKSHRREPDGTYANYLLGLTYVKEDRHAEAIPFLSKALAEENLRGNAMRLLMVSLIEDDQLARGEELVRMYTARYPENAYGWWWDAKLQERLGQSVRQQQAMANFLRHVERTADQADVIAAAQKNHDYLVEANKKKGQP